MLKSSICMLFATLLGFSSVTFAQGTEPSAPLLPTDFARGVRLNMVRSGQPFYRIELPKELYTGTAWTDMRDLRIFDSNGKTVPYSLVQSSPKQAEPVKKAMQVYALSKSAQGSDGNSNTSDRGSQVTLHSDKRNITVQISASQADSFERSYLLESSAQEKGSFASKIDLRWAASTQNWQARAYLQVSSDMKNWVDVTGSEPLFDLVSGAEHLKMGEVTIDYTQQTRNAKYWLLTITPDNTMSQGNKDFLPTIKGADIFYTPESLPPKTVSLEMTSKKISDREVEYTLSHPTLLSGLTITLAQNNLVVPTEVEIRSSATDAWHPLAKSVLYRFDGKQKSNDLPLNDTPVQGVRLRSGDTGDFHKVPTVRGSRDEMSVVFNASGVPPFILAWGARAANDQALPIGALVPRLKDGSSTFFDELDDMPQANIAESLVLGGAERLTAISPAEKANLWEKGLLWVLLVVGALSLVWMAMRLWREMAGQATKDEH